MEINGNTARQATSTLIARGWVESIEMVEGIKGSFFTIRGGNHMTRVHVPEIVFSPDRLAPQSVVEILGTPGIGSNDTACADSVRVIAQAEPMPVDLDQPDLTQTRYRHLHLRTAKLRATVMFRHYLQKYAREFLEARGFIHVHTPIMTEASCVCSGDVFTFPYYNKKIATLIQSPWMYADALVSSVERVYALNPSFRREKSPSNTHLVEIWQLQVDGAWETNESVMKLEEEFITHLAMRFAEERADLYEMAELPMNHLLDFNKSFPRISYDKSIDRINNLGFSMHYGEDFDDEALAALGRSFGCPFFVTDYPKRLKNFWFPSSPDNPELTPSNDLFAHTGHGEIIGGGERVHDAAQLADNLAYYGHDLDEFDWFLETRKFGCVPHAGFSIGFDRLTAMLMGVDHIRKATVYPRLPQGGLRP